MADGRVIRRRRECFQCKRRFTTKEYWEETPLVVIKNDGRREPFDREKLKRGIVIACNKRPVSMEALNGIVERVEAAVRSMPNEEVESQVIGELVMKELRKLDEVAYVRFASVYRKFRAKEEFLAELEDLKSNRKE